jgi:hypothetical protein
VMSGGREIPTLISTPAIVGIGMATASTKSIDPKSNFFISLPPYLVFIRKPLFSTLAVLICGLFFDLARRRSPSGCLRLSTFANKKSVSGYVLAH